LTGIGDKGNNGVYKLKSDKESIVIYGECGGAETCKGISFTKTKVFIDGLQKSLDQRFCAKVEPKHNCPDCDWNKVGEVSICSDLRLCKCDTCGEEPTCVKCSNCEQVRFTVPPLQALSNYEFKLKSTPKNSLLLADPKLEKVLEQNVIGWAVDGVGDTTLTDYAKRLILDTLKKRNEPLYDKLICVKPDPIEKIISNDAIDDIFEKVIKRNDSLKNEYQKLSEILPYFSRPFDLFNTNSERSQDSAKNASLEAVKEELKKPESYADYLRLYKKIKRS
jgi:hypothetical protein